MARALRRGRGHVIGIVVPRLHLTIFSEILQGIEEEAQKRGYMTTVCVTEDDPKIERDRLNRLRDGGTDGVIIAATGRNGTSSAIFRPAVSPWCSWCAGRSWS